MKPKITKLNDPANPYSTSPTPIAAPSADQQARNRAASQKAAAEALKRKPKTPLPVSSLMQQLNDQYMGARHRAIENGVSGKVKR